MDDRRALLVAIGKYPAEDTPRLAYADWLDEHPDLSGAAATAEFLRLACRPVRGPWRMPRDAYAWLKSDWKRLVPSVVALSVPVTEPSQRWPEVPAGGMYERVRGADVETYVTLPGPLYHGEVRLYSCRLRLHFGRGLLEDWSMGSPFGCRHVEPELERDQPQAFLRVKSEQGLYWFPDAGAADAGPVE